MEKIKEGRKEKGGKEGWRASEAEREDRTGIVGRGSVTSYLVCSPLVTAGQCFYTRERGRMRRPVMRGHFHARKSVFQLLACCRRIVYDQ